MGLHADTVFVSLMSTCEKQGKKNWFWLRISEARVSASLGVKLGISFDPVIMEDGRHASLLVLPAYGILALFLGCGEDAVV